jgi:site-specific recombinase XerD
MADPEAVRRLLDSLDDTTFDGLRFRTTILLMLDTGVRAGEVCAMDVGDIAADGASVRVWGKGARERTVYLSRDMTEHLRRWVTYRGRAMECARMEDKPVLFPSLTGARQISVQVGDLFRSRCKLASITPAVKVHGLRHLWATNHGRAGTNAFLLRQLGGKADMQVVMTYVSEVEGSSVREANGPASLVRDIVGRRVPRRQGRA